MKKEGITRKHKLAITLIIAAIASVSAIVGGYSYSQFTQSSSIPKECNSVYASYPEWFTKGYSYVCGIGSASDGHINITIHNYHFAQAKDIQFRFAPNQLPPDPDELFLLINVTYINVGKQAIPINPAWVNVSTGASYCATTEFVANATFSGTYPNQTYPDVISGPTNFFLLPGQKLDLWLFFYMPYLDCHASAEYANSHYKLSLFIYYDSECGVSCYYEGYGKTLSNELLIVTADQNR